MQWETLYGKLLGTTGDEFYPDGSLKSVIVTEYSELKTDIGILIPNYSYSDGRKKYRESVAFYQNGKMRSIYLEEQTQVPTSIGEIKAELITFYENGQIKRIFPLYGQITGYWPEEAEFALAEELEIELLGKREICKPQCIHFYPSGALRSITIWPETTLEIDTKYGTVKTRVGVEVYENGCLKSIEPMFGTKLQTEHGIYHPYNPRAFTMHADNNSLKFDENGICSVVF